MASSFFTGPAAARASKRRRSRGPRPVQLSTRRLERSLRGHPPRNLLDSISLESWDCVCALSAALCALPSSHSKPLASSPPTLALSPCLDARCLGPPRGPRSSRIENVATSAPPFPPLPTALGGSCSCPSCDGRSILAPVQAWRLAKSGVPLRPQRLRLHAFRYLARSRPEAYFLDLGFALADYITSAICARSARHIAERTSNDAREQRPRKSLGRLAARNILGGPFALCSPDVREDRSFHRLADDPTCRPFHPARRIRVENLGNFQTAVVWIARSSELADLRSSIDSPHLQPIEQQVGPETRQLWTKQTVTLPRRVRTVR